MKIHALIHLEQAEAYVVTNKVFSSFLSRLVAPSLLSLLRPSSNAENLEISENLKVGPRKSGKCKT